MKPVKLSCSEPLCTEEADGLAAVPWFTNRFEPQWTDSYCNRLQRSQQGEKETEEDEEGKTMEEEEEEEEEKLD